MKKNLLLLHGALGSKEQFSDLSKLLIDDFNIFSLNFSGHGGEKIPEKPFSIELFAEDILRFLEENNLDCIDMFGYSMGGYVAMYMAKDYPEKIGNVFTIATKFMWNEEIAENEIKQLDAEKLKQKIPAFAEQLKQRHAPEDWENILKKTSEMMQGLGKNNILGVDDYNSIEHEILIGLGDRDKMVTMNETIDVYKKLKNAKLLILPDTPHPFEQMNFDRLTYEIRNFFM